VAQLLRLSEEIEIPATELVIRVSRSAGPGGQHANVTESRVEVSFDIATSASLPEWARERLMERLGERASAVAQEQRSQLRNREVAIERLAKRLQDALARPPQRRATRPSRAARERRLQEKRKASERKSTRRPPPTE
jgi:ribosome-associated protein